jgi:drug/metabolite transporter (DMT)-like permease
MASAEWFNKDTVPYVGVLIAVISVSFASIFIIWSDASPIVIAAYRMLFATLMLLPFARGQFRRRSSSLSNRSMLILAGIGVVLALHFYTWNTSLTMTSVAASTLLVNAHPILIGLVSIFYLKEMDRRAMIGILLGFLGIVLISIDGFEAGDLTGDLFAIMGCVFAAIYILSGRIMRQKVDIIPYAFFIYAFATVFLFASSIVMGEKIWPMSMKDFLLFILLAGVSTIMGHTVYNWSLRYVSASFVSVSLLGEPIIASALALLFFAQMPSPLILVSGIMLLAGIVIVARYEIKGDRR